MRDASNRKGQKKWTAQQHKGPFAIGFKQGDQLEKKLFSKELKGKLANT